jgi:hypothetical protein
MVRGHTALNAPARLPVALASALVDLSVGAALVGVAIWGLDLPPTPRLSSGFALVCMLVAVWIGLHAALGASIGQLTWKLRLSAPDGARPKVPGFGSRLIQAESLDAPATLGAIALTALISGLSLASADFTWFSNPVLARAAVWELEPWAPPAGDTNWNVQPFFYSLGVWPRSYHEQPILFELPYEKGPPKQFVGHVVARWEMPDVKVTLEGPRTPVEVDVTRLRSCLTSLWYASSSPLKCLSIRDAVLLRHVREIRKATDATRWELKWFEIKNPGLPPDESPIGIHVSGVGPRRAQDRFILINPRSTEQAFILDRPLGPAGDSAREVFEQAVRSQRIFTELNAGRAWIDRKLSSTRIDDLKSLQDMPTFVARIAELHALLLSKISVSPQSYDAYFHLGGTALLLARHAAQKGRTEWTALAKPLVNSAWKYAKDVGPDDPRTVELHNMRIDAQDY